MNRPLRAAGLRPPCRGTVLTAAIAAVLAAGPAAAQSAPGNGPDPDVLDEIRVTGTRQIIQDQIAIKRNATTIVDGLSADELGDLPALSIGEALETITGAASHRENGGATEISIRGLGPFLSATTFNGRAATNGSGDRSVNFSQFPSELMSKLAIYKTQDASLIEGGVAGLIALETLKPLDYDERRFQFDLKGNYNPDQQNIAGAREGDIGYRGTLSYIDQFELDALGEIGISLGYQNSDTSQPEAEVRSSSPSGSSRFACLNDPAATWEGYWSAESDDCEDQVADAPYDPDGDGDYQEDDQGYVTDIDPATGRAYSDGLPFAFAPSSRGYRQNDTSEEREAFFGAFQWRPNERWDINLDLQISERVQAENRYDLNFANQKRSTAGVTGPALVTTDSGAVVEWLGETAIESNSEAYSRAEDYYGGGLNLAYDLTDRLTVSADLSYSETTRIERQISVRMQSDDQDIFDADTAGGYRPLVHWDMDSGIPQYTITDFDVTDPTLFSDEYRVRIDSDVDRKNTIGALRTDFLYDLEWRAIASIEGGLRWSELEYLDLGPTRWEPDSIDDGSAEELAAIAAMNEACYRPFPESDFLSSVADGDLVTIIDSATGAATSGTGSSWATFDNACITDAILAFNGETFAYPEQPRESPGTTDVTEDTLAAYLMANFDTNVGDYPVHGNFGVRVVNTEVESVAYRTEYEIVEDPSTGFLSIQPVPGADLERVAVSDDYTEVLPSFNVVLDLTDDLILRAGVFRGMSRPDPADLGYFRTFELSSGEDVTDPDDLLRGVDGSGNPFTQPLMSWNFDTAVEWYPNEDSILAVGVYYKQFTGGFEQVRTIETFTIDGEPVQAEFTVSQTNEDTSDLYGIELTGSHRFSYLPGYLSGLGVKLSYNYGDSNFRFEDSQYGDVTVRQLDGTVTQLTEGIIPPGNVPGFSRHVFSGQLYYQVGDFDVQAIYKYRSEYFQPYTGNGTRLRYIGDVGVWEARASYRFTDNVKMTLEGINLFDEPKKQYFFVHDDLGEVNVYGPRIFLGLKAKFF